jgi:two-component system C4-dicarboxylate transport sensor histidine kinase DctB
MSGFAPQKKNLIQQYRAMLVLLVLMVFAAPLLIYKTVTYTRSAVLDQIHRSSAHTLNLVVENLHGELARFQALPHLLAADPTYRKLWAHDKTPADERRINLLLEKNKNITGALDLYIMDPKGLTIAASNWQSKRTFIGRNFSFRPYFQQGIQGSLGRYFALGTTSRERGYYFSYPIREKGHTLGVMVCKIKVGHFETAWQTGQDEIIVTDQNGIIFLSSKPDWLFRSLTSLSLQDIKRIRANRQYDTAKLLPLGIIKRQPIDKNSALIDLKANLQTKQLSPKHLQSHLLKKTITYLQLSRDMKNAGWQVHILAKTQAVQAQIWRNALAISILLFSFFSGGALLLERFRRNRERIDLQSKARAELEHRVDERTRELQQAQSELIQAGKLAALGKMSAGLSHELNQPLAAIRSYSDNAGTFLERGLIDPAKANLRNIGELTDRMARIIRHLRTYASKDKIEAGPTDLAVAVREALAILRHRIDKEQVTVIDEFPERKIIAHGGLVRLQQVFVNILTNALDAIAHVTPKQIVITLEERAEMYIVMICDTGQGLKPAELNRVFDPFFSTKEVGEGVGLGLSISYGIIQQFGGYIEIENCERGGAALKVALLKEPLTEEQAKNV